MVMMMVMMTMVTMIMIMIIVMMEASNTHKSLKIKSDVENILAFAKYISGKERFSLTPIYINSFIGNNVYCK